jgi:hypothetical protein
MLSANTMQKLAKQNAIKIKKQEFEAEQVREAQIKAEAAKYIKAFQNIFEKEILNAVNQGKMETTVEFGSGQTRTMYFTEPEVEAVCMVLKDAQKNGFYIVNLRKGHCIGDTMDINNAQDFDKLIYIPYKCFRRSVHAYLSAYIKWDKQYAAL